MRFMSRVFFDGLLLPVKEQLLLFIVSKTANPKSLTIIFSYVSERETLRQTGRANRVVGVRLQYGLRLGMLVGR